MQRRAFLATAAIALALATATPVLADDGAEAVVEAYLAAWNAHDSAAAAAFFAPDVVYYDASVGTPIEGRDAAKTGVIDNFLTAVPDASWKMKGAPVVQDGSVAFEWEFSGTNTGPWGAGAGDRDPDATGLFCYEDAHHGIERSRVRELRIGCTFHHRKSDSRDDLIRFQCC